MQSNATRSSVRDQNKKSKFSQSKISKISQTSKALHLQAVQDSHQLYQNIINQKKMSMGSFEAIKRVE
jgi:hypothetical protein